jgi:hypothetical protein
MSRESIRETLLCLLAAAICLGGFCAIIVWIARMVGGLSGT